MTTESNDQPLRSAGLLYTTPSAPNRCAFNNLPNNHGVVAQSAAAASMNQESNGYSYLSEYDKANKSASSTAVVTVTSNVVSSPAAYISSVSVPNGWKRLCNKEAVCYISPSNAVLSSLDQVKIYLKTQGTCKCGLECPLHSEQVFNFDTTVTAKPAATTCLDTMTNLCSHKRKMMFNNVDSRLGKNSFDLADNRKKRKMSNIQQQFSSFPPYEEDKPMEKENYSQQSSMSNQMQWPDVSAGPNQMRFLPQTSEALLNAQMMPVMSECSPSMINSHGTVMPSNPQNAAMMANSQNVTMMSNNLQGTGTAAPHGHSMPNNQGSQMDTGNPRLSHYSSSNNVNYYSTEVGYEQSCRNGFRYNSPQCRSHDTADTMQPNASSCQPQHHQQQQQYQTTDDSNQEYYQKNNVFQRDQNNMQYNNYDSQRTHKSFNCSSHCGQYCNPAEQNSSYDNQIINQFQQQQPHTHPPLNAQSHAQPHPQLQLQPHHQVKPQLQSQSQLQPNLQVQSQLQSQSQLQPNLQVQPQPQSHLQGHSHPHPQIQLQPQSHSQPQSLPQLQLPQRQNDSVNDHQQYYQQMYHDQNNYHTGSSYVNSNGNCQKEEYVSSQQYQYSVPSTTHHQFPQCHHINCNCKNNLNTPTNCSSIRTPALPAQARPPTPQTKQVQQPQSTNVQQTIAKPTPAPVQPKSTPPWQLNKFNNQQQVNNNNVQEASKQTIEDRVPPVQSHSHHNNNVVATRTEEKTIRKPTVKQPASKPVSSCSFSRKSKSPSEEQSYPSFLEDPSGYLAQQTALLNNTISTNSFSPLSPPIRHQKLEKPAVRFTTNVTTMTSGRTVSCNTVTSVLAGKTNTSVVTVSTAEDQSPITGQPQQHQQHSAVVKSPLEMVQNVVSGIQLPPVSSSSEKQDIQPSHILLTSNGQLIMASAKLQTPGTSQVLVNALQGGQSALLLQPGNVMTVDQMQVPQLTVTTGSVDNGAFSPRSSNLLSSPDCKRKTSNGGGKKRKSPQISPNQGNVMLHSPQQNYHQPVVQTLILPNKTAQYHGNPQLITNVLQPVSLVHNLPAIQQFIMPTNLGGVVMTDNGILQDGGVHLNVITPFGNAGQNVQLPAGMVLRTAPAQTQQRPQQSNQFIVNNVGQLSPILANISPNQSHNHNRNHHQPNDFIHVVPCSVQQNQENNTTVVQQNTTIVQQQMTMVSGQQGGGTDATCKQGQHFILADNKQQGFILSPKDSKQHHHTAGTHYILNNVNSEKKTQSFIITSPTAGGDKQLCGNFILEKSNSSGNFIITTSPDKSSKYDKHSVSTQTAAGQQQHQRVLQISPTPTLLVATSRNTYVGSPPDTTTLSPVSGHSPSTKPEMPSSSVTADLDSALSPSSTFSDMQNRQPMVHCISSSNVVDWSDNSADERKTTSSASGSPNMYTIEHTFPR
ncbi:uncharacterized protein LOC126840571 [Adelges cooleyi]|uniref:uncharacterized protein LOC126840571 n=1 Tax=Adelges cooleyi TaxID=133065 RepID=UPI00217F3495|nr:uncharacterized protein LOC126840571 [Adelges cooleyi]